MKKHEIKLQKTFADVLNNSNDQWIVRQLLEELVPEDVKAEIVRRFNAHAVAYNQRCLELFPEEWEE